MEGKVVTAPLRGIEVPRDDLHPWLKPHCKDLVVWALRLGCAAIFASFGLHKTAMQLEWCRQLQRQTGGRTLNVVPLGVRHGFIKEALQLGMDIRFVRTDAEVDTLAAQGVVHFLTNYESIREGKLDPNLFEATSLDEASVLRSYGSKTFQEFLPLFAKVTFKLVATATPSPNRYKELIHYSGFLGVMDTGLALTRFFQRNSEKAGDLTLYPHKVDEFWMWMHSWAAFLQRPSDLGYSDDGYEMPPADVRYHELPADHSQAEPERDGQAVLFRKGATSLQESAKARRDSLPARIAKMTEIIAQDPDATFLIWHDLEAEREAIEKALPGVVAIMGSMDLDERERHLHEFEEGRLKYFATKPILSGSGSNFQYHCHRAIYVGMPGDGYKFNDFIQSLYRLQRFGQAHPVQIDIIYAEDMRAGRSALEEKWALDAEMRRRMSEIIRRHGLNALPLRDALLRSIGVKRVEVKGQNFVAINNDAVEECRAWPENSVDLIVSSIPFGQQYEYSPSYRDFGHSDDNAHFWSQMDFLSTELLRMLKPGRLFCCHVKDRIRFGAVTGQGVPTVEPFHAEAIMHYRAHGFQYLGMITVVTDVVRENNQTYRLGWSENAKDGTKMGCGMPEYILLLRKPQSDRSRSYADVPVTKSKEDYTRARWQIDAHGLWKSSGNRFLTPEEFAEHSSADLAKWFAKTSAERIYDFEAHVTIGEAIERTGTLPATFMAIAPGSSHPDVWTDVNRMRTLNMMQARKGQEMHLCPLQFDIVDRLIERYSNAGDLVFDPFGGLMTVPYRALLKGRKGAATELSATYFLDGVHYLHSAEEKLATPALFDLASFDAANTPPPPDMMEPEA
ncbi:MAG: DNA methyltransferase [bacterium]|nr:DNA methyltransferase [bacterium]